MKMANGGYDPAYNVQFASDGNARVIVGVDVTNAGTDGGELEPMHEKVCANYGKTPKRELVDGAYATIDGVTAVERPARKWCRRFRTRSNWKGMARILTRAKEGIRTNTRTFAHAWRNWSTSDSIACGRRSRSFQTPTAAIETCVSFASAGW